MLTNTIISKLLSMTPQGAAKWRKENRAIILFLDKYLSKEEIEEFLVSGKIKKFDEVNNLVQVKHDIVHRYANIFMNLFFDFVQSNEQDSHYFRQFILNLIEQCSICLTIDDVLTLDSIDQCLKDYDNPLFRVEHLMHANITTDKECESFSISQFYAKLHKYLLNFSTVDLEKIKLFKEEIIDQFEKLIHPYYLKIRDNYFSTYFDENGNFLPKYDESLNSYLDFWEDHKKLFHDETTPFELEYIKACKEIFQ